MKNSVNPCRYLPRRGKTKMSIDAISFDAIPRTSRLYHDFLYDFSRVERFYQAEGRELDSLAARAVKISAQPYSRDAVADVLVDQNLKAGAGETAMANIERLRQKDSVVVITGQQAGFF